MSYVVALRNKQTYRLTDEEAWSLKNCLAEAHGTILVEIGDDMIRSSEVVTLNKETFTEADIPNFQQTALPERVCRSEHSIQREISLIAKRSGKDWTKLIISPTWREEERQRLQASGKKWCDDKAGTCACEPL